MNGSAFSASLRQRSACSFRNELSIFDPNATHHLGTALNRSPSALASRIEYSTYFITTLKGLPFRSRIGL
jgi:hypothetical protein